MRRQPHPLTLLILTALMLLAAGCAPAPELDSAALFPAQVGNFTRSSGPGIEAGTGVDVAIYEAAEGAVTLRIEQVPEGQAEVALSELPATATDIGPDAALGQRGGVFFTFGGESHAAWTNGDWVFVLSASTDLARRSFLASYSY